jgi:predicted nucleic acid-binding protein
VRSFLLDTNVPSELIRARPEPRVGNWVYAKDEQSLYLSAVSIGELRRGFVILPASKRRTELELWFENDLVPRFRGRILPVTFSIADRWGILDGECQLILLLFQDETNDPGPSGQTSQRLGICRHPREASFKLTDDCLH